MEMIKMFWNKESKKKFEYNPNEYKAVVKCSICTGEQVAGFKNLHTGQFTDVKLIRSEKDLQEFKKMYALENVEKE